MRYVFNVSLVVGLVVAALTTLISDQSELVASHSAGLMQRVALDSATFFVTALVATLASMILALAAYVSWLLAITVLHVKAFEIAAAGLVQLFSNHPIPHHLNAFEILVLAAIGSAALYYLHHHVQSWWRTALLLLMAAVLLHLLQPVWVEISHGYFGV